MVSEMLYLPLRLIQSALSQKVEAKPRGSTRRERRQGRTAMGGREVASLPSGMGLPLGRSHGRASPCRAKSVLSASFKTGLGAAHAVSGTPMALVLPAITSCIRNVGLTDEVPRRPGLGGQVTARYKPHAKGSRQAPVTGRGSPPPRLWGCQQRQSRGAPIRVTGSACSERQNLRVPVGSFRFMGPVSPAIAATKWPDRTSSDQLAGALSNSPQQPVGKRTAVRSR